MSMSSTSQQQQLMFYVRLQSPIFLLLGAALHWLLLLSFVLCSFLLVCLLLLLLQLLLLGSDGFQVTGNEQVNKLLPFLVGLQGSSKDLDFSGQEPEDSGNSPGNSVVAWNHNIDVLKRSISVAEGNGGDIDIGGFNDGLSVVLGVSDDEESGLLELLGGLIGQGSRDPPGGG